MSVIRAVDNRPYGLHCANPSIYGGMSVVGAGFKPARIYYLLFYNFYIIINTMNESPDSLKKTNETLRTALAESALAEQ
ncbi:MAG: hypothetical protein LBI54_00435, partial [Lachnospiraceae bacterium]|nr:hypothetical protein [Lachnospiraceae bacterium]